VEFKGRRKAEDMSEEVKTIRDYPKNEENPFMDQVMMHIKEKNAKIGNLRSPGTYIDNDGVEHQTSNAIYTRKMVDSQQFVKLYTGNIKVMFDLTKTGIRIFGYFLAKATKSNEKAYFNQAECMDFCSYTSKKTVYNGLSELLDKGIIARTENSNEYFINPALFFNGDRMIIVNDYVKQPELKKLDDGKEEEPVL
jgi:hypothetical protein